MHRDETTLLDIGEASRQIQKFTEGITKEEFIKDPKTQSAVLHQLLITGEATKRLSQEFRAQHPDIPWQVIASMRDILIHAYNDVDLYEVWKTVSVDVPDLLKKIEHFLPNQSK